MIEFMDLISDSLEGVAVVVVHEIFYVFQQEGLWQCFLDELERPEHCFCIFFVIKTFPRALLGEGLAGKAAHIHVRCFQACVIPVIKIMK